MQGGVIPSPDDGAGRAADWRVLDWIAMEGVVSAIVRAPLGDGDTQLGGVSRRECVGRTPRVGALGGRDRYGTGVDLLRLHAQGQHPNNDGKDGAQGDEKWEGGGGSQDSESGLSGRHL